MTKLPMPYVLQAIRTGRYVAYPGRGRASSVTDKLQHARQFPTREIAERERCPDERIVTIKEAMTPMSIRRAWIRLRRTLLAARHPGDVRPERGSYRQPDVARFRSRRARACHAAVLKTALNQSRVAAIVARAILP